MKISVTCLLEDTNKVSGQKVGGATIWESNKQKLLGVHIHRKLSFDEQVSNLCKKAGRKLSVLARLSNHMTLTQ